MITFALLVYTSLLTMVAAPLMRRCSLFDRAPNLGILAWQVLQVSTVLSLVLAGLVLVIPTVPVSSSIAEFVHTCVMVIRQQYATPGGAIVAGTSLALALTLLARTAVHLARISLNTHRHRRDHRQRLELTGHTGPAGITVLEAATPVVYCLPGRHARIVATSAALTALDAHQLGAVLAHEHAHLRRRHHLLLLSSAAIAAALPLPSMRTAHAETTRLVELAADDAAAGHTDHLELAEALLTLAENRSPATTLAAGTTASAVRVRRLLNTPAPPRRFAALAGVAAVVLALLLPLAVAAGPAVAAAGADHCPIAPTAW